MVTQSGNVYACHLCGTQNCRSLGNFNLISIDRYLYHAFLFYFKQVQLRDSSRRYPRDKFPKGCVLLFPF